MNFFKCNILVLSYIFLIGCTHDSQNLSTGVSLEGTGKPTSGGGPNLTIPPIFTEDDYEVPENEFTLWSAGHIEKFCDDLKIGMQLIHPVSWEPLSSTQGYPILYGETTHQRLAGIMINITNLTNRDMYHILEGCQPNLQFKDASGNLMPTDINSKCSAPYSLVKILAGKTLEYKSVFTLPEQKVLMNLIYKNTYTNDISSLEDEDSQMVACEIEYPLLLVKQ